MRSPLDRGGRALLGLVAAGAAFSQIGSIFMPAMDEGTPVLTIRKYPDHQRGGDGGDRPAHPARASWTRCRRCAASWAARGADELGIDPVGLNETDMFLTLAPREHLARPRHRLAAGPDPRGAGGLPRHLLLLSQPIELRVQEMIIGARGDVVVKVFGPDLARAEPHGPRGGGGDPPACPARPMSSRCATRA